jgi:hypothetical protein
MSSAGVLPRSEFLLQSVAHNVHRWDDDVIFKNQARGTEDKRKKEFVNVSPFEESDGHVG